MDSSPPASQELIFLDPDDDLATVRAKLESSVADEIYVVVPRNASILRTPLEFRILGRLAGELSSETVIVSPDAHRRFLARQEGFRTKTSLHQLRHLMAPDSRPSVFGLLGDWLPVLSARTAMLFVVVLASLAGFGYFILPEMRVTLAPKTDTLSREVDVTVDANALRLDPARRTVPGRKVEQRVEVQGAVQASGTTQVGRSRAIGEVLLFNQRTEEVQLPRGTAFVSDNGVRFVLDSNVVVPPKVRNGVPAGIIAVEPGAKGNLQSRTISRFEDPAQFPGVELVNQRPTSGGTDREGSAVADRDMTKLRDQLMQQARDEAALALQSAAGNEVILPEGAVQLTVVDERFDQEVGAVGDRLSGRLAVIASALGAKRDDVAKVVDQAVASQLDPQMQLVGQASVRQTRVTATEDGTVKLRVSADAVVVRGLDATGLEETLKGKSVDEARSILATVQGLATPPKLNLWPDWSPSSRAFRVNVEIAAPR